MFLLSLFLYIFVAYLVWKFIYAPERKNTDRIFSSPCSIFSYSSYEMSSCRFLSILSRKINQIFLLFFSMLLLKFYEQKARTAPLPSGFLPIFLLFCRWNYHSSQTLLYGLHTHLHHVSDICQVKTFVMQVHDDAASCIHIAFLDALLCTLRIYFCG